MLYQAMRLYFLFRLLLLSTVPLASVWGHQLSDFRLGSFVQCSEDLVFFSGLC